MIRNTVAYPTQQSSSPSVFTNEEMTTESQRYDCFTRNGGNAIPKHAGSEAKGSNPTTGLILLWARNPFRGNFNHWKVSRKKAGQFFSLNWRINKLQGNAFRSCVYDLIEYQLSSVFSLKKRLSNLLALTSSMKEHVHVNMCTCSTEGTQT